MADADEPREEESLSARLDHLFRTVRQSVRREYTLAEVAEEIRARGGPTISATYIWQLRRGERDNPTKAHIVALAGFFGVPPAYFFDDEDGARLGTELDLLLALRDPSVRRLAALAAGVSPETLAVIGGLLAHLRRLEGLPDPAAE